MGQGAHGKLPQNASFHISTRLRTKVRTHEVCNTRKLPNLFLPITAFPPIGNTRPSAQNPSRNPLQKWGALSAPFWHNGHMHISIKFSCEKISGLFPAILLLALLAFPAPAADLPVEISFASRVNSILARVLLDIPPEYHAYANRPGPAGKPTELNFILEGQGSMPTFYPHGTTEPDIYDKETKVNVYNGPTPILVTLPATANGGMYAATLDLLLCSNRHCVPVTRNFAGTVPTHVPPLPSVPWADEALALLEQENSSTGALSLEEGIKPPPRSEMAPDAGQKPGSLLERQAPQQTGNEDLAFSPRYYDPGGEIHSLWKALLFGLVAGLLLNVMPCVLPVLTLKVSGILMLDSANNHEKLAAFRKHNICFAAGVLVFFTALALLLGAADMMWGQLYQNEAVLLVMLVLVFLMGLSMLGVFTLPMLDLRFKSNPDSPNLNAFLTGLLSTFLATPCSGPLLGGVLAWAFIQPLPILMGVFWSVGLGMSLPYLSFSLWPGLARYLPRPGAWMHIFEKCLGFLLLCTAIYLLSILPQDKYIPILCILLLAAFCAWTLHTFCGLSAPPLRRHIGGLLTLLILAAAIFRVLAPTPQGLMWNNFAFDNFSRNLGKIPMLLEFTADWCPNCKYLENTVLDAGGLRKWQQKYNVQLVKVDLTHANPEAQKLLADLGSKSIPLTALFPGGRQCREPVILRDIYNEKDLGDAMDMAFSSPGAR